MSSEPIQQRLRRAASGLFSTAQYHARLLSLSRSQHTRPHLSTNHEMLSTSDEQEQVTSPCDAQQTASFQIAKEKFERISTSKLEACHVERPIVSSVSLPSSVPVTEEQPKQSSSPTTSALVDQQTAQACSLLPIGKQEKDHLFFVGNVPTLPIDLITGPLGSPQPLQTEPSPMATDTVTACDTRGKLQASRQAGPKSKNTRYRNISLLGAGLVAFILVALVVQNTLAHQAFFSNGVMGTFHLSSQAPSKQHISQQQTPIPAQKPVQTQPQATPALTDINASKAVVRLSQLDPNQYASEREFDTWAYSACSTAALTEVFNAYGRHYRITDVLKVEVQIGAITPEDGLLENTGIARTAEKFGFTTQWSDEWTLDQMLHLANQGHPVIVDWPPSRYPNGHIVVVVGGDPHYVYLADSSIWNRQKVSRTQFLRWWGKFAAVVTPM